MDLPKLVPACGLILGLLSCQVGATTPWAKLRTDDVVILSDAHARDIVEFAVGYAAFRHVLREFFGPNAKLPSSTVLLFASQNTLREYLPPPARRDTQTVSFSAEVDAEALLALAVGEKRAQALELTYEFETTWTLRRLGYFIPLWMAQGTGEVFASLQVRRGKCLLGDGPDRMASSWQRTHALPWNKFFELHNESPEYTGPRADGTVQAQAWALMHRILLAGSGGKERFEELAAKLRTTSALDAVEAMLGVAAKDLEKDLNRHLSRRDTVLSYPFDEARVRAALKPVPAAEAEVQIALSNLLIATGKPIEAEAAFARAQAAAPQAPAVKEWLARRELREGRAEEAATLYREAIVAGTRNSVAYLISADQRMTFSRTSSNGDRAGCGGTDIEDSLKEVRHAIQLNPGSTYAYGLLGRALFLLPKVSLEHVTEVSRGVVRGANSSQVQFYRALLYERLEMNAEYIADLRQLESAADSPPGMRRAVTDRLQRNDFRGIKSQVEKLVTGKNFAEARGVVEKAKVPELTREVDVMYAQLSEWVLVNEKWEELNTLFRQKSWTAYRKAAQEFIEAFPKSPAVPQVRKMDSQAKAMLKE